MKKREEYIPGGDMFHNIAQQGRRRVSNVCCADTELSRRTLNPKPSRPPDPTLSTKPYSLNPCFFFNWDPWLGSRLQVMLGWFRLQIGRVLYVPYVLVDMRTNIPSKAPKTYKKKQKHEETLAFSSEL